VTAVAVAATVVTAAITIPGTKPQLIPYLILTDVSFDTSVFFYFIYQKDIVRS